MFQAIRWFDLIVNLEHVSLFYMAQPMNGEWVGIRMDAGIDATAAAENDGPFVNEKQSYSSIGC